jgi:5-deoxy-D-glucuronate isomerase
MRSPRVNLFDTDDTGITEIMAGPWKAISVKNIAPGDSVDFDASTDEYCLFTLSGTATVTAPDSPQKDRWEFEKGSTLTLPQGGRATVLAGREGMQYLLIEMTPDH